MMRMINEGGKRFPIFERKDGSWSKFPPTVEEARTYNRPLYDPFPSEICSCGKRLLKFTDEKVGGNYCCTIDTAIETYNSLVSGSPISAAEAKILGFDHYFTHKSCEICGALNKRKLNGKCYSCANAGASPRQAAVIAGDAWYVPLEVCDRCGERAKKRVNNGECSGCVGKAAESKQVPIRRQWPDMVISREDALSAKMNTYRTGEECKYGHAGWRWVSTRGCLTCQGRD